MDVNVELHEMINEYVNSVKLEDIHKELDILQQQYNVLSRVERDIWHLIELGENLSVSDKLGIYDLLEQTLKERRYAKTILKKYMHKDAFDRLVKNGTIAHGKHKYIDIVETVELSRGRLLLYTLRSSSEDDRITKYIESVHKSDEKFSFLKILDTREEISEIQWRNK